MGFKSILSFVIRDDSPLERGRVGLRSGRGVFIRSACVETPPCTLPWEGNRMGPQLLKCQLFLAFLLFTFTANAADIWVSPKGNDQNNGSKELPLATPSAALRRARELRRLSDASVKDGIHIILKGGIYPLDEAIFVRPEDSGTVDSPTTIEAAPGERPVLSGGVNVSGWVKAKSVAGLPRI
jgi:hypothetical protein